LASRPHPPAWSIHWNLFCSSVSFAKSATILEELSCSEVGAKLLHVLRLLKILIVSSLFFHFPLAFHREMALMFHHEEFSYVSPQTEHGRKECFGCGFRKTHGKLGPQSLAGLVNRFEPPWRM
jgi:hypothetical protein